MSYPPSLPCSEKEFTCLFQILATSNDDEGANDESIFLGHINSGTCLQASLPLPFPVWGDSFGLVLQLNTLYLPLCNTDDSLCNVSHPIFGPRHLHQLAESPTCPDPCLNGDNMTQPRGRGGAPSVSGWCPLLQGAPVWQLRKRPRQSRQQWSPVQEGASRSHLVLLPATKCREEVGPMSMQIWKELFVCFSAFLASWAAQEAWINSTANPIHHVLLPKHCVSHLLLLTPQEHKMVAHLTDVETKVYNLLLARVHTRI